MAADIGQIAQLLNATLDPAQHRQGMTASCVAPLAGPRHRWFVLINKSLCSRDRPQAGSYQAAILSDFAQYRCFRLDSAEYSPLSSTCVQELHPNELRGTRRYETRRNLGITILRHFTGRGGQLQASTR